MMTNLKMTRDPIFRTLSSEALRQIAAYLKWDPFVGNAENTSVKLLSQCDMQEQLSWLDAHRTELEQHISWVGTPVFSYAIGNAKSYREILKDIARLLGLPGPTPAMSNEEIESKLLEKLWAETLSRLTKEDREALLEKVETSASQYGHSFKKEMAGFAGLAAAQMSGFGVYILGSTLLGAVNSALGLGLSFGAFTGLSSAISVVIGPIGWAALGLYTIKKIGAPNHKKLLPVVILVATQRAAATLTEEDNRTKITTLPAAKGADTKASSRQVSVTSVVRHYTNAEKRIFSLRAENRELCEIVGELEPEKHFLDLSEEEQGVIRELIVKREQDSFAEKIMPHRTQDLSSGSRKAIGKDRKRTESVVRSTKREKWKSYSASRLAKDYSRLLRNLEFDAEAIERMELLTRDGAQSQVEEKLGLMNAGQLIFRNEIGGTYPKIYEAKAGLEYRIYFYRDGPKIHIVFIGDKGTQDHDIERLRARFRR